MMPQPSGAAKKVLACSRPFAPAGTSAVVGTAMPAGASGSLTTSLVMPLRPLGLRVMRV